MSAAYAIGVVLDPGHGGADPGMTAPGLREADIAFALASRVADALVTRVSWVRMTRLGDVTTTLRERCRVANGHAPGDPRVFVSLHVNARGPAAVVRGAHPRGAQALFYKRDTEGERLAGTVLDTYCRMTGIPRCGDEDGKGPRPAGMFQRSELAVLRGTTCPAALLEVAFGDSPVDRALLLDADSRSRMATALAEGVLAWCAVAGVGRRDVA